jgi:hypothetical protein
VRTEREGGREGKRKKGMEGLISDVYMMVDGLEDQRESKKGGAT